LKKKGAMDRASEELKARQANWLPIPFRIGKWTPDADEADLFPKGRIARFYPMQGAGEIETDAGATLSFALTEAEIVGPKGDRKHIRPGCRVGYDVSMTSKGLRPCRIKVY